MIDCPVDQCKKLFQTPKEILTHLSMHRTSELVAVIQKSLKIGESN